MAESATYTLEIHHEPGYGYEAEVKELPGCFASGDTMEELYECLGEAIGLYLSTEGKTVRVEVAEGQELESSREERILVCS